MVVLDNLREGVITPDIYDATLNPLYRDVLKHYGAVALPCRVRDPDRKGKVRGPRRSQQQTRLRCAVTCATTAVILSIERVWSRKLLKAHSSRSL